MLVTLGTCTLYQITQDSLLDSGFSILWISGSGTVLDSVSLVSGTGILNSNNQQDSRFLELYSGFQSLGFRNPQEKFSRVPGSTRKKFFPAFQKPDYLTWGNQLLMDCSNPVEVLNFFQASHLCNCINCVHNCKDHSLFFFDLTTAYCWSLSGDGVGQLHEISSSQ